MIKLDTDSRQVDDLLNILDDDEIKKKVLLDGLRAGGKVLQDATKSNFKAAMGEAASHYSRFINRPFYEGVTLKADKAYTEVTVSIMSDYRMRFYEKQIKQRQTKKGYNRGVVEAKHFFANARNSTEGAVNDAISRAIKISLDKYIK